MGKDYAVGEEIANSIIHGIGFLFSIAALALLVVFSSIHGTSWHILTCTIYGITLVLLYGSSTLYHSLTGRRSKKVFQVLDHASIYLLIAGTYTPVVLVFLRDGWGWPIFGFVWTLAIGGIVFKSIWIDRMKVLSVIVYGVMGWCILIAIRDLLDKVPAEALIMILAGGIAYTAGIPLYAMKDNEYLHTGWHVMVLGGSIFQFMGILLWVVPIL